MDRDITYNDEIDGLFDYLGIPINQNDVSENDQNESELNIYSDDDMDDIDFSSYTGDFKKSLRRINHKVSKRQIQKPARSLKKSIDLEKNRSSHSSENTRRKKSIPSRKSKISLPSGKSVLVKGVNDFILTERDDANFIKNINYYKGKKLNTLILEFDNSDSLVDFNFELFNPSMPLDYLQSTGLNINDKIKVANSASVSYTDLLFNIVGNPTMLVNAQFIFAGTDLVPQINQPLFYQNKDLEAISILHPMQVGQQIDTYQFQNNIVYFNIKDQINRPFCPDGMDIMRYKVMAGMVVTFAFYFKQILSKKVYFPEARNSKKVI